MSKKFDPLQEEHISKKQKPRKNKTNNAKYTVCLDTNVVISLAGLHNNNQTEINTLKANKQYASVKAFKEAIEKRQIVAVITPIVLQEILKGVDSWHASTLTFLQKSNIFVLDMPEKRLAKYFLEIENIATNYSKKLNRYTINDIAFAAGNKPSEYPSRIFNCKTDKATGQPIIQNDARIMAEAAKLGLVLVTNNTLDFIHKHRPELISKANRQLGLPSRAIPVTTTEVLQMYKRSLPFPKAKTELGVFAPASSITITQEQSLEA